MDTGDVKIKKTGSNGIQQMSYQRKVADFSTFIKSSELFTKGTSVKTTDKVSSKSGDKDYKQLIAKIKMIGEKANAISAKLTTNPESVKELNEAMSELNTLNTELLEYAQELPGEPQSAENNGAAGQDLKAKLQSEMEKLVSGLPQEQIVKLKSELEGAGFAEKQEDDIQATIEPNEVQAQQIIDDANNEPMGESLIMEGYVGDKIRSAITALLQGIQGVGAAGFFVYTVVWAACEGNVSNILELIGQFGGAAALAAFILHGMWILIEGAVTGGKE